MTARQTLQTRERAATRFGAEPVGQDLPAMARPWLLARLARWRARREEGHSWPTTLVLGRWRWTRDNWRNRTYYLLAAAWIGLIFVPFPND
jgi:hypothetical protein